MCRLAWQIDPEVIDGQLGFDMSMEGIIVAVPLGTEGSTVEPPFRICRTTVLLQPRSRENEQLPDCCWLVCQSSVGYRDNPVTTGGQTTPHSNYPQAITSKPELLTQSRYRRN